MIDFPKTLSDEAWVEWRVSWNNYLHDLIKNSPLSEEELIAKIQKIGEYLDDKIFELEGIKTKVCKEIPERVHLQIVRSMKS